MCGIAGWFRRGGRPVGRGPLEAQAEQLVHRGPDDHGCLIDHDFGFAMRRLSIIDVSGGHQPITSADGRFAIVCNGEIVNHRELRQALAGRYGFRTQSDVETMLAAYAEWGDEAWGRLLAQSDEINRELGEPALWQEEDRAYSVGIRTPMKDLKAL